MDDLWTSDRQVIILGLRTREIPEDPLPSTANHQDIVDIAPDRPSPSPSTSEPIPSSPIAVPHDFSLAFAHYLVTSPHFAPTSPAAASSSPSASSSADYSPEPTPVPALSPLDFTADTDDSDLST